MKAKITPGLIVVLVFGAWLNAQGQINREQRAHRLDFELSPYGTLLKLQVDGKTYGERSLREGYAIGYRVGADERIVYAYRDQPAGDLSPAGSERQSPNSRVVTTKDGVLRVTSRFSWDNKTGMVTIRRDIENVSSQNAELLSVKSQIDNYLAGCDPEMLIRNRRVKAGLPCPLKAWVTLGCAKPPCGDGCCSSCPVCTGKIPSYATPGVIFRPANEGQAEISTPVHGPSLPLDQLKKPFDLTLHWTTGTDFVDTRIPPHKIVTIIVEVRLRK